MVLGFIDLVLSVSLDCERIRRFHADGATDGSENGGARFRLAEVTDAADCLGLPTYIGIVEGRDKDNRGGILDGGKSVFKVKPGHPSELNVEHQAIKLRVLLVREKLFGVEISDHLQVISPEEPAQGTANGLVIVNDRDVNVLVDAHPIRMSSMDRWRAGRLLPLGAGSGRTHLY
jgi:hypothetical protein